MYIVPKIEVREAEDIADFATTMDSDMNLYFEEKNELLEDIPKYKNDNGAVFYPAVINLTCFMHIFKNTLLSRWHMSMVFAFIMQRRYYSLYNIRNYERDRRRSERTACNDSFFWKY